MTESSAPEQIPDPQDPPENSAAVVLDGKRYALDALSETAQKNIASIRFCDEAIQQKRNELAIADTARMAYQSALNRELAKGSPNDGSDSAG